MKYNVIPTKELLKIDEDWRERWAKALDTSNQHKGSMCNSDDTAHCCLCVLERLNGAMIYDYDGCEFPSDLDGDSSHIITKTPDGQFPENIVAANAVPEGEDDNPVECGFACLNDNWLTHKQIASLLRGNTVEVEIPDGK